MRENSRSARIEGPFTLTEYKRMTVNELLAELRRLQREGRGTQQVYVHRQGDNCCTHSTNVASCHNKDFGHVVIRGRDIAEYREG